MCSSPKIHDLSSPINDWRQETNETQNYALLATELHTKYTFAGKQQQQQKWKKTETFVVQMKKRSFSPRPVSHRTNDLKYSDKFKITPLGWGCTQPTMTRIMSGLQTFLLSAFTSKQKSARKWKIVWIHITTSRMFCCTFIVIIVAFCHKLETDARRTSKPNNKYQQQQQR